MTLTWVDRMLPVDRELFNQFYSTAADFHDVTLRSIRFVRNGAVCILRVDLPVTPDVPGYSYVQAHMQFFAVDNMHMDNAHLPVGVSIGFAPRPIARLAATITGASFQLSLTCADQIRFGKISFHNSAPDSLDDGPHQFTSKLNQMLYTTIPEPEASSYHDYI